MSSPQQTVDLDVTCAACGYNLRTISVDSQCPECGRPVHVSLESRFGRWGKISLHRLQLATRCMAITAALYLAFLATLSLWAYSAAQTRDLDQIFFVMKLQAAVLALLAAAHLCSAWVATEGLWPPAGREFRIRIAAISCLFAQILSLILALMRLTWMDARLARGFTGPDLVLIFVVALGILNLAAAVYFWDSGSRLAQMRRETGLPTGTVRAWGRITAIGTAVQTLSMMTPYIQDLVDPHGLGGNGSLINATHITNLSGLLLACIGSMFLIATLFQLDARLGNILHGEA